VIWLLALLGAGGPETLVDRVVAVVEKEVITESELLIEARVSLVLRYGEGGVKAAAGEIDSVTLGEMQRYVITEVLVANQVRRIGSIDVSEQEIDLALKRFSQAFGAVDAYRAFVRKFDIAEAALRGIVRRNLRNDKFLKQRHRGHAAAAPANDEAVLRWVNELIENAEIRLLGPNGELEECTGACKQQWQKR
jgi:hypothetical protein